jgi:hypothetical protein
MPSGDICSDWLRPRTVINQVVEPSHASVLIRQRGSSCTIPLLRSFLTQT